MKKSNTKKANQITTKTLTTKSGHKITLTGYYSKQLKKFVTIPQD